MNPLKNNVIKKLEGLGLSDLSRKIQEIIDHLDEEDHPMYVKEYNEVPHRKEEKCIIALCTLRSGHTGFCFNTNASEGKGKCCGDCRLFYPRQNLEECSDYNCSCHKPQECKHDRGVTAHGKCGGCGKQFGISKIGHEKDESCCKPQEEMENEEKWHKAGYEDGVRDNKAKLLAALDSIK